MIKDSDLMHGIDWDGSDPTGWWICEKFDGVRAYWDGKELWTRSGRIIYVPDWFRAALPIGQHLDGELWAGRGNFQLASNAARYGGKHFTRDLKLMVFDCPKAQGFWPDRLSTFTGNDIVKPVYFRRCEGAGDLSVEFQRIKDKGGEGLVIRSPKDDKYFPARTSRIQKVK